MNDSSRTQGLAICAGAVALALIFGSGLLSGAWWAVAIPVAVLLAFVLGLTFWVGYTLATVAVEPEPDVPRPPAAQAAPPPGEGRRDGHQDAGGESSGGA